MITSPRVAGIRPTRESMPLENWKFSFEVLGLIAVSATLVFGGIALALGRQIEREQAARLRQFDANIATANERAADANRTAEEEKHARVKIEAAVAWRQLSDTDKRAIGAAGARFKALVKASFWFNASDTEAQMFADDIAEALQHGHITVQPPSSTMLLGGGGKSGESIKRPFTGVTIRCTEDDPARNLAATLIAELKRRGFDAVKVPGASFTDWSFSQIAVTVEPRPRGPQGEYKLQAERETKAKNEASSTQK